METKSHAQQKHLLDDRAIAKTASAFEITMSI